MQQFKAHQLSGWKIGVWVGICTGVVGDMCVQAWCVEGVWHAVNPHSVALRGSKDGLEGDGFEAGINGIKIEKEDDDEADGKNPSPRRTTFFSLVAFDMFILTLLTLHVSTYILSLPSSLAFCNLPDLLVHPDIQLGGAGRRISPREACVGLNVDIHVAGGFAVAWGVVLGVLHALGLGVRFWEWMREGGGWKAEQGEEGGGGSEESEEGRTGRTLQSEVDGSHASNSTAIIAPREAAALGNEVRTTEMRFVDCDVKRVGQARRRACRSVDSQTEEGEGEGKWSEALLECLVDG